MVLTAIFYCKILQTTVLYCEVRSLFMAGPLHALCARFWKGCRRLYKSTVFDAIVWPTEYPSIPLETLERRNMVKTWEFIKSEDTFDD